MLAKAWQAKFHQGLTSVEGEGSSGGLGAGRTARGDQQVTSLPSGAHSASRPVGEQCQLARNALASLCAERPEDTPAPTCSLAALGAASATICVAA